MYQDYAAVLPFRRFLGGAERSLVGSSDLKKRMVLLHKTKSSKTVGTLMKKALLRIPLHTARTVA
jgi:hypothetical protein